MSRTRSGRSADRPPLRVVRGTAADGRAAPDSTTVDEREPAPLGSWARLYGLVIGALALEIVLLALLTRGCR